MYLLPRELDKLAAVWDLHRDRCRNSKGATLEESSSNGIGTVTKLKCACGVEIDITDYHSW